VKSVAEYNVASMLPYVEKGYEVVATEPTATFCFRELYPKLLKTKESVMVAEHSREYSDYLSKRPEIPHVLRSVLSGTAGLHVSCHQRALTGGKGTIELMNRVGVEVKVIETGTCCGMGGTVGLKTGPLGYDLSSEVGRPLFELFRDAEIDLALSESSVCTINLEQGACMRFEHPLTLLAAALEGKSGHIRELFSQ
jgi:Fe-S oxidoreductase